VPALVVPVKYEIVGQCQGKGAKTDKRAQVKAIEKFEKEAGNEEEDTAKEELVVSFYELLIFEAEVIDPAMDKTIDKILDGFPDRPLVGARILRYCFQRN
jgi:hypothetical protein